MLRLPSLSSRFLTGIALLFCVVLLWTTSNFITSDLLEGGYNKPFIITYLNTSAFSLYLIPFLWKRWRTKHTSEKDMVGSRGRDRRYYLPVLQEDHPLCLSDEDDDDRIPPPPASSRTMSMRHSNSLIRSLSPSPALITHHSTQTTPELASTALPLALDHEKLTTPQTAKLAATFCAVWFAANWTVNASLGLTSVGSSTVLAGMSGFFTLGLGRMFGVETFTKPKVMAVLASFFGLLLVTHSDSLLPAAAFDIGREAGSQVNNPIWGDMLALASAFCYAVYVILLKVQIGNEEKVDMQLFFGFVGLFNTIFLLPIVPILSITGLEPFELPKRRADWIICAINMTITLSSDYLYVLAMLKTTPLVVTIGLSLTIPLAMLGDFLRGSTAALTTQAVIGAVLVILGFGLMGFEGWEEDVSTPAMNRREPEQQEEEDIF